MAEETGELSTEERAQKIQSLREMIGSAEKTIQGAKAMLLQVEGKKKTGRKRKIDTSNGTIIEGTFDGQIMIGTDGRQYPVPANYASKSKLIEGDVLKLTITDDGSFIYKQIGPADRKNIIGIVSQDERGNYYVIAEGKPYKVLLASVTYFHAEPGDEVTIVTSQDENASWAIIESILSRAEDTLAKFDIKKSTSCLSSDSKNQKENLSKKELEWSTNIRDVSREAESA